jgi:8-oxo-dGTP pyrophosphatase MutT (NUDIX family)
MTSEIPSDFVATNDDVVHSWAVFRLLRRTVRSPRGEQFERTYVSTPGAVAVVAITADSHVVLVSQYRATFDSFVLELPAGMRDVDGEPPSLTAARELKEETGFTANSVEYLGTCLSSPGVTDSSVEVFVSTDVTKGESEPHGPEEDFMTVHTVPMHEALRMVEDGEITDAKTAYGLLLAARQFPHLLS